MRQFTCDVQASHLVMSVFCLIAVASNAFSQTVASPASTTSLVVANGAKLTLVADGFKFTEGPAANADGEVFFTDQPNDRILRCDLDGNVTTWLQPSGRSNGVFFASDKKLIACADGNNELWEISLPSKEHRVLLSGYDDKRFNGPNDVWVHKKGWIYFTDPYYKRPYWEHADTVAKLPRQVYRFSPSDGSLKVAAADFEQPNGIVGDPSKGVVFVADIGDKKTYRFKIDENGDLTDRRLFCEMGSDGMTLDNQGNLYLTGKGVTVFDSTGKRIEQIDVPESWTANVCFGGREHKSLFVTASDSLYRLQMKHAGIGR